MSSVVSSDLSNLSRTGSNVGNTRFTRRLSQQLNTRRPPGEQHKKKQRFTKLVEALINDVKVLVNRDRDNDEDDDQLEIKINAEFQKYVLLHTDIVKINQRLSAGNFGDVYKINFKHVRNDVEYTSECTAAAKRLKADINAADGTAQESTAMKEFRREQEVLINLEAWKTKEKSSPEKRTDGHNNIMGYYGTYLPQYKWEDIDGDWITHRMGKKGTGNPDQWKPEEQKKYTNMVLDGPLLITKFYNGQQIDKYIRKKDGDNVDITWGTFVKWFKELADGLAFLARANIFHRDLAPRNIMLHNYNDADGKKPLPEDFTPIIIDYGISRISNVDDSDMAGYIAENSAQKLPVNIIAVENLFLAAQNPFNNKSDIWSLGVAMWELSIYCERRPYELELPQCSQQTKIHQLKSYLTGKSKLLTLPTKERNALERSMAIGNKETQCFKTKGVFDGGKRLTFRKDMPKEIAFCISDCWIGDRSQRIEPQDLAIKLKDLMGNKKIMDKNNKIERGNKAAPNAACTIM